MQEINQENIKKLDQTSQSLVYIWKWDERLDKRLTSQFTYSRSFFEHIIKRWNIYMKNKKWIKKLKKSYKLQSGDTIYIDSLERFLDGGILEEAVYLECRLMKNKSSYLDKVSKTNRISYIPIVYEATDYMVIYKPKWVLSHPNSVRDLSTPSVVASIYHYIRNSNSLDNNRENILPTSWSFIRAWLVHRLDKDTDGYMVVVKTEEGLTYFKELFQQKSLSKWIDEKEAIPLTKRYTAISTLTTKGKAFLKKVQEKLKKGEAYYHIADVIPNTPHPVVKEWISKILEIEYTDSDTARIYIEILTGRTHQIRYHLSSVWLPIVWDYLYHFAYINKQSETLLHLSSSYLAFEDIYGKKMIFRNKC